MKKGIYIVATPIGNLGDITPRAIEVLEAADIIACEDTRVTKKLFSLLNINIKKTFISMHDHNESEQLEKIIDFVKEGKSVAQVSDAGCPLISDPGYKLIRRCKEEGIYYCTIPGPCALICALQLSGLPTNSFMFAGFIPNKDKARADLFGKLKEIDATLVFYETANRIIKTLEAAQKIFPQREMAVAREITKVYEECLNGSADELLKHFRTTEPKGEMVLMIAPPQEEEKNISDEDIETFLRAEMQTLSLKSAVKKIAEQYNRSKNEVYELALKIKDE